MEQARRTVLRDQASVVKRALQSASEQTRLETRQYRIMFILVLFLLGGIYRFVLGGTLTTMTLRSQLALSASQPETLTDVSSRYNVSQVRGRVRPRQDS